MANTFPVVHHNLKIYIAMCMSLKFVLIKSGIVWANGESWKKDEAVYDDEAEGLWNGKGRGQNHRGVSLPFGSF